MEISLNDVLEASRSSHYHIYDGSFINVPHQNWICVKLRKKVSDSYLVQNMVQLAFLQNQSFSVRNLEIRPALLFPDSKLSLRVQAVIQALVLKDRFIKQFFKVLVATKNFSWSLVKTLFQTLRENFWQAQLRY